MHFAHDNNTLIFFEIAMSIHANIMITIWQPFNTKDGKDSHTVTENKSINKNTKQINKQKNIQLISKDDWLI